MLPKHCKTLFGPRYALLRREFIDRKPRDRIEERCERILVFWGGTDPVNMTETMFDALVDRRFKSQKFTVVMGANNSRKEKVIERARNTKNVKCLVQVDNMAQLMDESDLFFGAGGTVTWERCRLGLPSIVVSIADNQIESNKDLAEDGFTRYLGHFDQITVSDMKNALGSMIETHFQHPFRGKI